VAKKKREAPTSISGDHEAPLPKTPRLNEDELKSCRQEDQFPSISTNLTSIQNSPPNNSECISNSQTSHNMPAIGSSCYNNQSFPVKLHYIIERETSVVRWNRDNTSFRILDTAEFEKRILTQHFRTTRLSSFTRNLNIYGFKKIAKGEFAGSYYHPKFSKESDVESLTSMKRSTTDPRTIAGLMKSSDPQSFTKVQKLGSKFSADGVDIRRRVSDIQAAIKVSKSKTGNSFNDTEGFVLQYISMLEDEMSKLKNKVATLELELERCRSESKKNAALAIASKKELQSYSFQNTRAPPK